MARKPRAPKEKREPAHKMDGDGMELTGGDGSRSAVESEKHMLPPDGEGVCSASPAVRFSPRKQPSVDSRGA